MAVPVPAWLVRNSAGVSNEHVLPKINVTATAAPTVNDDSGDGYTVGSMWIDVTNDETYFCEDDTLGAAVWKQVGGSVSAPLDLVIADAGTNNTVIPLTVTHTTSGTATTDFGVAINLVLENSTLPSNITVGQIKSTWEDGIYSNAFMTISCWNSGSLLPMITINPSADRVDIEGHLHIRASITPSYQIEFSPQTLTASRSIDFQDLDGTLALLENKLSVFAATTSAELRTVISDETGTGSLVFATSPTLTTPAIASFASATHDHTNAAGGGTLSAAAIGSGTMATARLGSGTANASTFLAGDQSYKEPVALTPIFIAYPSATKTATTLTWTQINANTETVDTEGWYNTSTYRFTPLAAGYYCFYALATVNDLAAAAEMVLAIYKNGSEVWRGLNVISPAANSDVGTNGTAIIQCNGSTDYIEFFARHSNGSDRDFKAGPTDCFWMGWRVR